MEHHDAAASGDGGGEVFGRLLDFLNRLDKAHIYYTLGHTTPFPSR
jgi:hypothetical protein